MDNQMTKLKLAALSSMGPKVDHPLAKYTSKGELICILCNQKIKNSSVWKVHISGKSHKEKLILFKTGNLKSNTNNKRPPSPTLGAAPPRSLKKSKPETKTPVAKPTASESSSANGVKSILKKSSVVTPKLPEGFVPKSQKVKEEPKAVPISEIRKIEEKSKLPSGFFDNNIKPSTIDIEEEEEEEKKEEDEGEASREKPLPEGFFDDAKQDAKARKVEYKDPKDVEWELFKGEMEQEDLRYENIIEEDDQKLRDERDYEIEIDQRQWSYRVESMQHCAETGEIGEDDKKLINVKIGNVEKKEEGDVKDEVKEEPMETSMEVEPVPTSEVQPEIKMEESDSDDDDFGLNWRMKSALR